MKHPKALFHKHFSGFSLLELLVVIALMAGLIAIAIPTVGVLTGTKMKSELNRLVGMASELYDRAAIVGKTHRLVIDFTNNSFWGEELEQEGISSPVLGYEDDFGKLEADNAVEQDLDLDFVPKFKPIEGLLGEKIKLDSSIKFYGLWTENLNEVLREGRSGIYFFPGGYAQSAFVSLSEQKEDDPSLYFSISPLTGEISTGQGEPEKEDLLEKNVE